MTTIAKRMAGIAPFHVMELMAVARRLEEAGRKVIHMEVGEPDFSTAEPIIQAATESLRRGHTAYTLATGLPGLREAIAGHYLRSHGLEIDPARIIVTPGASGAFQLAVWSAIDAGDEVLLADPGYPCNRHFVRLADGIPIAVPTQADSGWELTVEQLERHLSSRSRAIMINSPANPTGATISRETLRAIVEFARAHDLLLIADEVYHGLIYDGDSTTVLALDDTAFVVNSFSKYFGMTGWRLGWAVVPESHLRAAEILAQNLFIAPPTMSQYGALAAFAPETRGILERRKDEFRNRRDFLFDALRDIGFRIPLRPQGAFYLYAGVDRFTSDSYRFAMEMADQIAVTLTPGLDFGQATAGGHVRIAYTTSLDNLREGVQRLRDWLS